MGFYDNKLFENAVEDAIIRMFQKGMIRSDGNIEVKAANGSVWIGLRQDAIESIVQETAAPQQGDVTVERFDARFS